MRRKVSADEARKRLGELLDRVYYQADEVVIERLGKPMGVLIPMERYEAIERNRRELIDLIDRVQAANAHIPTEEIEAEVAKAVAEVRAERRRQAAAS